MKKGYDFSQVRRGPIVRLSPGKTRITIRLDSDMVNWFRDQVNQKGGGNYQTMINEALRSYMQRQDDLLEETLRRVTQRGIAGGLLARPDGMPNRKKYENAFKEIFLVAAGFSMRLYRLGSWQH